jgi:hypothetical protein
MAKTKKLAKAEVEQPTAPAITSSTELNASIGQNGKSSTFGSVDMMVVVGLLAIAIPTRFYVSVLFVHASK